MSATNTFENSLLDLIFTNADLTGIARGASSAGNLYISLHTADPTETGNQESSEANYTSYARVAVARSGAGWTVSGDSVSNAALISFPIATGGSSTVTHFGIGLDASGTGTLLLKGALTASLSVSNGIRPVFDIGDLVTSVD